MFAKPFSQQKNLIACLFIALLSTMATALGAQDTPSYDVSGMATGLTSTWETSKGHQTVVFEGESDGIYRFYSSRIDHDGTETQSYSGINQQSQLIWAEEFNAAGDYSNYYFTPHDCSFVIGPCSAAIFSGSVQLATAKFQTHFDDGIWVHLQDLQNSEGNVFTTKYCGVYDAFGKSIALFIQDSTGYQYWEYVTSGPHAETAKAELRRVKARCLAEPQLS